MNMDAAMLWEKVKAIALQLPETYEKPCYGTPAVYVGKKLLARLREDDESLALYYTNREELIAKNASVFFTTDHYIHSPMVLIHLSKVSRNDLEVLLLNAWKIRATKTMLKTHSI